jgi:predicted RecB family nuclease
MRFQNRARLLRTPGAEPYALRPLGLSKGHREIHFDIETDPMRDGLVYLHGFLIRDPAKEGYEERYHHIFAETANDEGRAFAEAMQFLCADSTAHIYYYSKYERSAFRALADRHPTVCSREDVERLFNPARATDLLFDVIMPDTEWPTSNLSIKTLARSLGFDWRDVDAGGAASIAWFDEYARTHDAAVKHRILSYNEDDVRASAIVLDGLRALPVSEPPPWPPASR